MFPAHERAVRQRKCCSRFHLPFLITVFYLQMQYKVCTNSYINGRFLNSVYRIIMRPKRLTRICTWRLEAQTGETWLNQLSIPRMRFLPAAWCTASPYILNRYDYGAPIREDRTLSPKYSEVKLQAAFLHSSPDFLVATRFGNGTVGSGTAFSSNPLIYTTALSSPSGSHFYVVRQNSVRLVHPPSIEAA